MICFDDLQKKVGEGKDVTAEKARLEMADDDTEQDIQQRGEIDLSAKAQQHNGEAMMEAKLSRSQMDSMIDETHYSNVRLINHLAITET